MSKTDANSNTLGEHRTTFANSERFCVFKSGNQSFGVPALAVRSIVPRPTITSTPHSDPILAGLCHIQNEFISVVSFQAITQIQYQTSGNEEQQLLILLGPSGPWGLLIDQVDSLAALEVSISTISDQQDQWSRITLGSATFENHVIQVVDPNAIFEYAERLLNLYWQTPTADSFEMSCVNYAEATTE